MKNIKFSLIIILAFVYVLSGASIVLAKGHHDDKGTTTPVIASTTPVIATTTPVLGQNTQVNNTTNDNFFGNYYKSSSFSSATTRSLKFVGLASGLIGLTLLGSRLIPVKGVGRKIYS